LAEKGRHIVISSIEHAAVDNPCRYLEAKGWQITRLPVDSEGFISPQTLEAALRPETVLVSIIHGNNEIGTIQPIAQFGNLLRERGVLFHTDAVQTVGKVPIDLSELPIDYLSMSAHKIYGPKGVGALYCLEGAPMPVPRIVGGGQENDWRSGTENLAGIVGLAKALELATARLPEELERLGRLQEKLIAGITTLCPSAVLNGPRAISQRVPGNVHFSFPGAEGESLVLHLDLKGIAVSSGSACHSAVIEPSRIILALGKDEATARGTVRFSMGLQSTEADVEAVLQTLPGILNRFVKETPSLKA